MESVKSVKKVFKMSVVTLLGVVMLCTSGSSMSMISSGDLNTQTESMVKAHETSLTIDQLRKLLQDNPVAKKKQIIEIFARLIKDLEYDESISREMFERCKESPWSEIFEEDVKYTLDRKCGACRQLSCRLIYELEQIGVESHLVHIWRVDNTMHNAVLYKLDGRLYVADLSLAISVLADVGLSKAKDFGRMPLLDYHTVLEKGNMISVFTKPLRKMTYDDGDTLKHILPIDFSEVLA